MAYKEKRSGVGLEIKVVSKDGKQFIIFRHPKGSYHMFAEIEPKDIARQFGIEEFKDNREWGKNAREMLKELWDKH